ncbi:MAG TPA: HIT family protein [Candidatus Saccharimonadia bacterium]|jgi:diadenosine tetraphosphate (Ap4A) HIT family hydrolase|nr:HIT family protein [Candidatus Saccharimonadia bacterium]
MSSGYDLRHARVEAQKQKMRDLIKQGICAFCEEHFETYHDNPVEFQSEHWTVAKNDYPYTGTALHLLVVSRKHVSMFSELAPAARADFTEVLCEVEKRWKLPSYAVGIRVGEIEVNGGTVDHLHAHIVVGDVDDPGHEPVRFKMSSKRA